MPDQQAELIAAARAAASWARTRRATWTDAPLPVLARASPEQIPVAAPTRTGPSLAARAAAGARALGAPVLQRLPRVAAMTALVVAGVWGGVIGGRYLLNAIATSKARIAAVKPPPVRPQPTPTTPPKTTGGLQVSSTPPGAQVLVDGKPRGVTPVTLADVSVGRHTIELRSSAGTVQRTVTVAAGKTSDVDESIFSGFLALYSPIEVVVTEGGRTLRFDERSQTMLPPGRHDLRIVNRALGYEAEEHLELKPGETARLTVNPPPSAVTVTATEAAEVWLDGARIGDAPVNAMPVGLGTHEIVVKRASGGERRFTVTVTVNPMTLNVDFSKPG